MSNIFGILIMIFPLKIKSFLSIFRKYKNMCIRSIACRLKHVREEKF